MEQTGEAQRWSVGAMCNEIGRRYRVCFSDTVFLADCAASIVALATSYVVMSFAITFATERASSAVTDLILSNTPAFDVDGLFVYGTILFMAFIALMCLVHPRRIPFTLYSIALFWLIRAGFVTLTHVGPFVPETRISFGTTIQHMFFGSDYFFSGHVGMPFLFALMYWRENLLRYLFLVWTVFFMIVVLLGHLHYSIDVFSAFFITYTLYHLAIYIFPRSRRQFASDDPREAQAV